MSPKLPILVTTLLLPFSAVGEEATPKSSGTYQLKNRSEFSVPDDSRAPFWPIGWSKQIAQAAPAAAQTAVRSAIDPTQYKITSILLGSPSLAVINGRAYEEGEYLRTPRGKDGAPAPATQSPQPRICVQRILENSVILQQGTEQAAVQFQRAGLAAKGPSRDLLLEDR